MFFLRDEVPYVKFPKDIEDAKKLGEVLSRYKDKYFYEVSHLREKMTTIVRITTKKYF